MRIRRPVGTESAASDHLGRFTIVLGEDYGKLPRLGLDFRTASPFFRQRTMIRVAERGEFPLDIRLDLFPGIMARGRVVTEYGDPVPGAQVIGGDDRINRTDGEGHFELYGLFPGSNNRVSVRAEGYALETVMVQAPEGGWLDGLEIVLSTATAATGRVFHPDGTPATGGEVIVRLPDSDAWMRETLDSAGAFHFPAIPLAEGGEYLFTAYSPGYLHGEQGVPLSSLQLDDPITLHLHWGTWIRGTVTTPEGEPATGGSAVLGDGLRGRTHTVMMDDGGRFEIGPVEPGTDVLLSLLPPPPSRGRVVGDLEIKGDGSALAHWPWGARSRVEIETHNGSLRMTRTDSGPGAMPGVIVYQGIAGDSGSLITGTVEIQATGASGDFEARRRSGPADSLEGEWEVRENTQGGTPLAAPVQKTVRVSPLEGWQEEAFRLAPPRSLRGTARAASGSPLAGGTVRVVEWNRTRNFQTGAPIERDGSFELTGLPEGVLTIQLLDEDNRSLADPVYLRAGLEDVILKEGEGDVDPVVTLDL